MEYIVERASEWNEEIKPCEECRQTTITCIDERTTDDPSKIPAYKSNPNIWYEQQGYFNHRVENGHIKRDYLKKVWVVEINSLEQLHEFVNKYGAIVFGDYYANKNLKRILIYDDYIE